MSRRSATRRGAIKAGFRSGFEQLIAAQLEEAGVAYEYEPASGRITYLRECTYTPDFVLENGTIIEVKGRFTGADRGKHERIRKQHPDADIRFVFQKDNPITKGSRTRYTEWCERRGIPSTVINIPEEWYG